MMRAERERKAYDEDDVFARNHALKGRFGAVFGCPNTQRLEAFFRGYLADVADKSVLEVGCGRGDTARALVEAGASYVRGIDIAESMLAEARPHARPGQLEFELADAAAPIEGRFDLVVGRAILHHLDWKVVLARLYADNLAPGGRMVFYEPLGSSPLMQLYWKLATGVHTPDERPFYSRDLAYLRAHFAGFRLHVCNWLSLPVGVASALVGLGPDNPTLVVADRVDGWVERHLPALHGHFRQAIFVIERPPA